MDKSKLLFRGILTALVLVVWGLVQSYISALNTNQRAAAVVGQLSNDPDIDARSRAMVSNDMAFWLSLIVFVVVMLAIWWSPLSAWLKRDNHGDITRRLGMFFVLGVGGLAILSGCGEPAYLPTKIITIRANESAFVIPYTGNTTDQGKFQSEQFLKSNQVATKQIEIPTKAHQTGGGLWGTYEIIDAATVITVDRAPVAREWTTSKDTGSNPTNQAFGVESLESIDFEAGGTVAAEVKEEDAAKFLYHYPSQRNLATIMDEQVHQYLGALLFAEFKSRPLEQDQKDAPMIFTNACKATKEQFSGMGITITSCGGAEGFTYHDKKIQDAINDNFTAEQAVVRARAALEAQDITNQKVISESIGLAEVARQNAKGEADALKLKGDQLAANPLLVQYEALQRWNGQVSQFQMGTGSGGFPFTFTQPLTTTLPNK